MGEDRVVVILGVRRIDCDERHLAPILAPGKRRGFCARRFRQRVGAEDIGDAMRMDGDEAHRPFGRQAAEPLAHAKRKAGRSGLQRRTSTATRSPSCASPAPPSRDDEFARAAHCVLSIGTTRRAAGGIGTDRCRAPASWRARRVLRHGRYRPARPVRASRAGSVRTSARSPMPGTAMPGRRRPRCIRIFGIGPCAAVPFDRLRRSIRHPRRGSQCRRGRRPAIGRACAIVLRRRAMAPSASSSLSIFFSRIRSAPVMAKARAISRLPIFDAPALRLFAADEGEDLSRRGGSAGERGRFALVFPLVFAAWPFSRGGRGGFWRVCRLS